MLEQAEHCRKTLEAYRASREHNDQQALELLNDIRNRYNLKINSLMGKKKNKANNKGVWSTDSPPDSKSNGWGAENDDNEEDEDTNKVSPAKSNKSNNADDWGNDDSANKSPSNNNKTKGKNKDNKTKNDWGGSSVTPKKSKDNKKDDAGWGANTSSPQKDNENSGWGASNANDDNNQESGGWGNDDTTAADDNNANENNDDANGWGDATDSKQNNDNDGEDNWGDSNDTGKGKKTATATESSAGWGDDDDKKKESKKDAKSKTTTPNNKNNDNGSNDKSSGKKDKKNKGNKANSPETTDKDKSEDKNNKSEENKSNTQKSNGKAEAKKDVYEDAKGFDVVSKGELLTAKLELRLLGQEKTRLKTQLDELQKSQDTERRALQTKLELSNKKREDLEMKVRRLTTDLNSANEEISKLNKLCDDLSEELEDRNKNQNLHALRRRSIEDKSKDYQRRIAQLEEDLQHTAEEKIACQERIIELEGRNDRMKAELSHAKNLIQTLKDGCALVESQAKTFEVRHDTVAMSKADLERELIAIKEESSSHITTINRLRKANDQLSKAFVAAVEEHESCKKEVETLRKEYQRRLDAYKIENTRLSEANRQLRKVVDLMQKKK